MNLLHRLRPSKKEPGAEPQRMIRTKKGGGSVPELFEFIEKRDYIGAVSLIEFKQKDKYDQDMELWLGHCLFRAGEYRRAGEIYEQMLGRGEHIEEAPVYLGCCYFMMGLHGEAKEVALKGRRSALQARLLFHVAHKLQDENEVIIRHSQLKNTIEDQISLASMNMQRTHYQQALDVLRPILAKNTNFLALNFYIALCYYKLDMYDNALEALTPFMLSFPDSPAAINLKACINYRISTNPVKIDVGRIANLYPAARDIIKHNNVVFANGENALQVLPTLVDIVPEARLNLIVHHLNHNDIDAAEKLCEGLDTRTYDEKLVKATTCLVIGQRNLSKEHIKLASKLFQAVGGSDAECDTIRGRQSMASYHFLNEDYQEVIVFLGTIKDYMVNDDAFNLNYGQALAMTDRYGDAVLALSEVKRPRMSMITQFLVRAYVMVEKPEAAWDLVARSTTPSEHYRLLRIIAHDAFKSKQYAVAARAYDALEKLDPSPDYWLGKRACTSAQFAFLVRGKCTGKQMVEVLSYLQNGTHSQVESITQTVKNWADNNDVDVNMIE